MSSLPNNILSDRAEFPLATPEHGMIWLMSANLY